MKIFQKRGKRKHENMWTTLCEFTSNISAYAIARTGRAYTMRALMSHHTRVKFICSVLKKNIYVYDECDYFRNSDSIEVANMTLLVRDDLYAILDDSAQATITSGIHYCPWHRNGIYLYDRLLAF